MRLVVRRLFEVSVLVLGIGFVTLMTCPSVRSDMICSAISSHQYHVVDMLTTYLPDTMHALDNRDYWTPLHQAAAVNDARIVALLLSKGASVDERSGTRKTPLHIAAEHGSRDAALVLLQNGANLRCTDSSGMTPLQVALHYHQQDMADLLMGADRQGSTTTAAHDP